LFKITSYTPSSNISEGSHTLYVREKDALGNWSPVGSKEFTINITAPTGIGPKTTSNGVKPTFAWYSVSCANAYNINIATDSNFTNVIDWPSIYSGSTQTYNLTWAMTHGTTYYWRIKSRNSSDIWGNSWSNTYSFRAEYTIGDTGPSGGIIFYDEQDSGCPDLSGDSRYISAAPNSEEGCYDWGPTGTFIGGTASGVGTGYNNTAIIKNWLNSNGYLYCAAQDCWDCNYGGFSGWFLPSDDELYYMYSNLKLDGLGNFQNSFYWTSTEYDANLAEMRHFNDPNHSPRTKTADFYWRPARYIVD